MVYPYNKHMNITIERGNEKTILPDPSEWNYQVGDLDTSGRRDANGTLHRKRVATKINYEFKWKALEWEQLQVILHAVRHASFTLTAPDPTKFDVNEPYTGKYYVGDRTGGCKYYREDKAEVAVFDLKLKFIEF